MAELFQNPVFTIFACVSVIAVAGIFFGCATRMVRLHIQDRENQRRFEAEREGALFALGSPEDARSLDERIGGLEKRLDRFGEALDRIAQASGSVPVVAPTVGARRLDEVSEPPLAQETQSS